MFLGLLFFSLLGTTAFAKRGGTEVCVGNYVNTSFGDLVVPKDETCQLDRFNVVSGNIKVEKGASLIVCPDNEIQGSVNAHKPNTVFISDLTVGLCQSQPPKALGITIGGDVKVEGGDSVSLIGNPDGGVAVIQGNVKMENVGAVVIQFFNNLSSIQSDVKIEHSGNVSVLDNVINGDLKIKGTTGSCVEQGNSVSGKLSPC